MPVSVEKLPDEPILMVKLAGLVTREEFASLDVQCRELADTIDGLCYRVADICEMKDMSFSESVVLLADLTDPADVGGSLMDPQLRNFVVAQPGTMSRFSAESLSQEQYGGAVSAVFESIDGALAHIRSLIAEG